MADNDDDRDSLSPHPFGMPEETAHRKTMMRVAVAVVAGIVLLGAGVGAYALWPRHVSRPTSPAQTNTPPAAPAVASMTPSPSASPTASATSTPAVSAGSALATLEAPPEHTVAMVMVPRGFQEADFSVAFTPVGVGPTGSGGGLLIAKVSSSKPAGSSAASLGRDFSGRTVALYATPEQLSSIRSGRRYRGTIRVRPQGDVGVLILTQVSEQK